MSKQRGQRLWLFREGPSLTQIIHIFLFQKTSSCIPDLPEVQSTVDVRSVNIRKVFSTSFVVYLMYSF